MYTNLKETEGTELQTAFSRVLTELRHQRGMSQKQAASDLGISQALLSHYENGAREPRLEFVVKVCEYYGVTSDRLLGIVNEENANVERLAATVEELLGRMREMEPEAAAAVIRCVRSGADTISYMLDHPGQPLPPERLIPELQSYADLTRILTEERTSDD